MFLKDSWFFVESFHSFSTVFRKVKTEMFTDANLFKVCDRINKFILKIEL